MSSGDDWSEWRRHVLSELKRLSHSGEEIQKDLALIQLEIARLKIKSGAWGALGAIAVYVAVRVFGTKI